MAQNNIHAYIIPTQDFHESEYVSEYFMARNTCQDSLDPLEL